MNFLSNRVVAMLLWAFPLLCVAIAVHLFQAAFDIRQTLEAGERVEAEVLEIYTLERSEYTDGYMRLRYTPPGAEAPVERRVTLPLTLVKYMEGAEIVPVRVLPGGDVDVVLEDVARPQWRMALIHSSFAALMGLVLGALVFFWNRHLRRHGDPAALPPLGAAA